MNVQNKNLKKNVLNNKLFKALTRLRESHNQLFYDRKKSEKYKKIKIIVKNINN